MKLEIILSFVKHTGWLYDGISHFRSNQMPNLIDLLSSLITKPHFEKSFHWQINDHEEILSFSD